MLADLKLPEQPAALPTPRRGLSIRARTLLAISSAITILALLAYLASYKLLLRDYLRLEERLARQDVAEFQAALQRELENLSQDVVDWSIWDDSYAFVADPRDEFIASNMTDATFQTLELNLIGFFDVQGRLVYGRCVARGAAGVTDEPFPIKALEPGHPLSRLADATSDVRGLLLLEGRAWLAAARPIVTSQKQGPIRGTLLMARHFDDAALRHLAQAAQVEARALPADAAGSDASIRAELSLQAESSATLLARQVLRDVYDRPALLAELRIPRDVVRQGRLALAHLAAWLTLLVLVLSGLTMGLVDRLVLARVMLLNRELSFIGATRDLTRRVTRHGADELARVSAAVNELLDVLALSHQERSAREAAVRALYEITAAQHLTTSERVHALLVMGCSYFGVNTGMVLESSDDGHRVVDVNSPQARVRCGQRLECVAFDPAFKGAQGVESVDDAAKPDAWSFRAPGGELLAGCAASPIFVGSQQYGLLAFSELATRSTPLSSGDCDLLQLMAYWIGGELERAKTYQMLRFTQFAIDHAGEAAVWLDAEGRVVYCNDAACSGLGYARGELLRMRLHEFDVGFSPTEWSVHWAQLKQRGLLRFESRHRTKSGRLTPVEITANYVVFDGKEYSCAFARDISERLQIAEELLRAKEAAELGSRAKGEFLANMSHEIRTPLTAILGFTENLLDPSLSEDERVNAIHIVRRNGDHLLTIINDILDLSKIEAGKLVVERIACAPLRVLEEVRSLLTRRAAAKNLTLTLRARGPVPRNALTDPTRLRQILINLVGNAIKFTEHGEVRIEYAFQPDAAPEPLLQFDIVDSGIGMTEAQQARLFQPFTQADASTTRRFGGTGLGLVVSRRLANLLGGSISVSSKLGVGSTFSVTIAAGPRDALELADNVEFNEMPPTAAVATQILPSLSGLRILLAEDGVDNQRLVKFILQRAGAELEIAANGQLAIEAVQAASRRGAAFDVILMDMQMPVLDGYEATKQLRGAGYSRPILALTANAMSTDRDKCLKAGCDDFCTKPIQRAALLETIHRHARGQARTSASPEVAPQTRTAPPTTSVTT